MGNLRRVKKMLEDKILKPSRRVTRLKKKRSKRKKKESRHANI